MHEGERPCSDVVEVAALIRFAALELIANEHGIENRVRLEHDARKPSLRLGEVNDVCAGGSACARSRREWSSTAQVSGRARTLDLDAVIQKQLRERICASGFIALENDCPYRPACALGDGALPERDVIADASRPVTRGGERGRPRSGIVMRCGFAQSQHRT